MHKYIDDVIDHKESDIEKIQTKPNMYISYIGPKGSLHLTKEIINNAIDETINPNSPGDTIEIYLDEAENTLSVSDNGRGIQFDKMELVCTKLQAGSKFTREGIGASAGENGVGLTAVNALSDFFEIISTRYGQKAKIRFEKGKLVQPVTIKEISNKDKHGTTVIFKPSQFFLGEDCDIPSEKLMEWIEKIIYLVPAKDTISLSINKKGKESVIHKKYKNKSGLYDYIKKLTKKSLIDPIHFMKSMKIKELVNTIDENNRSVRKEVERFLGLEVAFTFGSNSTEMISDSFCNFVNTIDGGEHVDAVKTAISQYISKQVKESLSEREAKNLDILFTDVQQGLVLTVYLSTDMQPHFASQTKEKLSNSEFFKPLRDMTYSALVEYFKKEPKELKKIIDFVKTNAKARVEATKVRNSVVRGETTNLDEHKMKNFAPANNKGKNDYRELIIIEGDSALGSVRAGRFDNDTQAVFALKGVPLNSFGQKLDKVLLNEEFLKLVKVLGCNIGERFDITKLRYNKIIIMTDADIDGHRITSLVCVFFICHLPKLVEAGLVYKSVPPLYKITNKKKPFILDKNEYVSIFEERIRGAVKLINPDNNKVFDNEQMKDFLLKNRNYIEDLHRLANHFAIEPMLMEFLVIHGEDSDFRKKFKKKFPELDIDNENVLSGVYNGKYQILIMDKIYQKRIAAFRNYFTEVNDKAYYKVAEIVDGKPVDRGLMTIGEFMTMCHKFQPSIEQRYKGLGELAASDLRDTTLDPENRLLIKLTMEDLKKEIEKFRVLHGDDSDERKKLMEHFKISLEDLDN